MRSQEDPRRFTVEPQRGFSGGQSVVLSSFLTVHKVPANMSVGTRTKFIPYLRISSASINVKILIVVIFAKDCLLTGQEQACIRITQLSFGCHHAQKGLIHRKNGCSLPRSDDIHRWYPFPDQTKNEENLAKIKWFSSLFCVKMLPLRKYEEQFLCKSCQELPIHIIYLLIFQSEHKESFEKQKIIFIREQNIGIWCLLSSKRRV